MLNTAVSRVADIRPLYRTDWLELTAPDAAEQAVLALEHGDVLFFPSLPFDVAPDERALFSPAILASAKNASYDPATGRVSGTSAAGNDLARLSRLMTRFSEQAAGLVRAALPTYAARIRRARASFRPAEIAGRVSSWRKDDTRLHVDAFPANPVQGRRILRVFSNVNPEGRARTWRVGEDFEALAARFGPSLHEPAFGAAVLLRLLRITKSRRSSYDAMMLQLHDRMKEDTAYQAAAPQRTFDFPAGSTWMTFTDQVSHAAMAGQYQLEQTFLLPVDAMRDQERSPLRVLERVKGRRLA